MNYPFPDVLSLVVNNVLGFMVQRFINRTIDSYTEYREDQVRTGPLMEEYRSLPRVTSVGSTSADSSGSERDWININR